MLGNLLAGYSNQIICVDPPLAQVSVPEDLRQEYNSNVQASSEAASSSC